MWIPLALLVLVLVLSAASRFVLKRQAANDPRQAMRASDLARRMRLVVVAGSPSFDYQSPLTAQGRIGVALGDSMVQVESRLEGSPDGYPSRLAYSYREERTVGGLLTKTLSTKTWFDCRFTLQTQRAIPQFEFVSRGSTTFGPIQRELTLPPVAIGDPALDAKYQVFTADPSIVPTLASVMTQFAAFEVAGVQVIGDGATVAFILRENATPFMGSVLYDAEQLQQAMTALAKAVGG